MSISGHELRSFVCDVIQKVLLKSMYEVIFVVPTTYLIIVTCNMFNRDAIKC